MSDQERTEQPAAVSLRRGLWFEDFIEGMTIETGGRTITEADIVNFAGVSGDFNPLHVNAEFARSTPFGARVAHGTLVFSIGTALAYQLGMLDDTAIAFTGFEMKLRAPVFIGDTIRVVIKVSGRRAVKSAGGGLVSFDARILNQKNEVVQKGEWSMMVKSRPESEASAESRERA